MSSPESRVAVDTNVSVSAMMFPSSVPAQVYRLSQARGRLLTSDDALRELMEVIYRPKFDRFLPLEDRVEFLALHTLNTERRTHRHYRTRPRLPRSARRHLPRTRG